MHVDLFGSRALNIKVLQNYDLESVYKQHLVLKRSEKGAQLKNS